MIRFSRTKAPQEISITVTNETFIRLALLSVGTIGLILAVQKAAHALLLVFIALFLALALNGPVTWLSQRIPGKRRGSRSLGIALSFFLIILFVGGFLASIVPPLVRQTQSFATAAPDLIRDFRSQDSATGSLIRKYNLEKQVDSFSNQLSDRIKDAGGAAFSSVQKIGSSIFSLLTILVLAVMMLIEGPGWMKFARRLTPEEHRDNARRLAGDMYKVITGFVNGQVTLAAIAAVMLLPAFILLDISYPIALMVIVFICGLIPMVGHTIGAIIVATVALFSSTTAAIIILGYYFLYQQFENYLIQPRIQANSTNMSPLLVFMSVVIGVSFGGLVGGLFAIPIAGCLRIAILEYFRANNIIADRTYENVTSETK